MVFQRPFADAGEHGVFGELDALVVYVFGLVCGVQPADDEVDFEEWVDLRVEAAGFHVYPDESGVLFLLHGGFLCFWGAVFGDELVEAAQVYRGGFRRFEFLEESSFPFELFFGIVSVRRLTR